MTSKCDRCHTTTSPTISTVEIFHGTTSMVKDLCYPCTLELEALLDSFPVSQIQDQLTLDDDADDIDWACDDLPYEVLVDA
jgi:hypothetical protein